MVRNLLELTHVALLTRYPSDYRASVLRLSHGLSPSLLPYKSRSAYGSPVSRDHRLTGDVLSLISSPAARVHLKLFARVRKPD